MPFYEVFISTAKIEDENIYGTVSGNVYDEVVNLLPVYFEWVFFINYYFHNCDEFVSLSIICNQAW